MSNVPHCLSDRGSLEHRDIASSIHGYLTERSVDCPGPVAHSAVAGNSAGNLRAILYAAGVHRTSFCSRQTCSLRDNPSHGT
jgi:hypothetical protein